MLTSLDSLSSASGLGAEAGVQALWTAGEGAVGPEPKPIPTVTQTQPSVDIEFKVNTSTLICIAVIYICQRCCRNTCNQLQLEVSPMIDGLVWSVIETLLSFLFFA